MRKLFSLFLALFASISAIYALGTKVDGIYYDFDSSTKTASVTYRGDRYNSYSNEYSGSVTIPETVTYNGTTYSVTSIGGSAFRDCSSLTSVTIPNSVTSIENSAFCNCSSLTSVTIGESVTSIGGNAFYDCRSLTSVTIPNSVTSIENGAFYDCSSLTSVTINSDAIVNKTYSYYSNLFNIFGSQVTECIIGNDVKGIGDWAFCNCSSLTSVTIPNSVTSIGYCAFCNCSSLTSLTIPNSVTNIGGNAFSNCSSLTSITIPNSVTSIGYGAFSNCSSLTSITIGNSVTSIGDYAFDDCSSLTSITIPNSVTSIGNSAFTFCTFVKDNFINNSTLDAVANNYWGAEIADIEIDGLFIRNDTVIDCRPFVTSVTIPNSVTSIGNNAFSNCSSLTSLTIPNSVTSIGDYAFMNCSSLTSITIPNSVTSIGDEAFYYCSSLTSLTIPNSVTSIGDYAFMHCSSLTSITIPNSVTSIGNYAFYDCSSLTSIAIPNSVTSIGSDAFGSCDNLTSITIPNSVTSIGDEAFYYCSSLKSIYCKALTPPELSTSSFQTDAYDNATLYVPFESIANYKADSAWGMFKNIQYIDTFYYNDICYQYIIGEELLSKQLTTEDDFNAFTNISVTGTQTWRYDSQYGAKMSGFQDNVTHSNEDYLISPAIDLSNCSSATLMFSHAFGPKSSIPTTVAQQAQYTCWVSNDFSGDVTTATWTELPITYGTSAWNFITTTVDIPAENLKANCHIAWKYVCESTSATWEIKSVTISGDYLKPNVRVISKNSKYSNDITIPSIATNNYVDYRVTTIAANAFSNCSSLTSISIPNSVTSIGSKAFSGCTSLKSITIPNSVTSLPTNVFANCTSLNDITLPASVKSIGENAFAGCTKLYDIYCYAMEPPTAYESSFANYNAFLHVPCDNQRVYLLDVIFGEFKYIECIGAETTTTDTVVVDPSFNDAEFTWPSNSDADTYILAISKEGEVFCTLTFNANGQLTGIAFAPSRNRQRNAPTAQATNGFAFTVTGLNEGSIYTYDLVIKDSGDNIIQSYSGKFRTLSVDDRTVTVEYNALQGKVTGAGNYLLGDTATLTAIPNEGYRFVGWEDGNKDNPRTITVTSDTTFTAEFAINQYEISFYNWDGTLLQSTMVDYGAMPEYLGETPTKSEDDQYVYTFIGWEPEIAIVVANAEYTAQYEATPIITDIENTPGDEAQTQKLFRNGQLFIIRGGKTYNAMGQEM